MTGAIKVLWLGLIYLLVLPYSFAGEARVLSPQDISLLESGEVISEIWRDKSNNDKALDAFAAVHIKASPQHIWAVMKSCEASVKIIKNMTACEILERSPDGTWDIREQRFRAPFPVNKFRTVFRTDFTPFQSLKIQRSGGDMKVQEGVWTIKPLGNGYSRVTYEARVALKLPVPRFILTRALRKDTPELMMNLRDFAERASETPHAGPVEAVETSAL